MTNTDPDLSIVRDPGAEAFAALMNGPMKIILAEDFAGDTHLYVNPHEIQKMGVGFEDLMVGSYVHAYDKGRLAASRQVTRSGQSLQDILRVMGIVAPKNR